MRLRFWGTRGSCPSPGPSTVRYGGNTTCVEVRSDDGHLIILDAGTGIRELGRTLVAAAAGQPIRGDVFFSHAHWDHIQGLPFFTPAFQAGNHFRLFGAPSLFRSLEVVLRQQMSESGAWALPEGWSCGEGRLALRIACMVSGKASAKSKTWEAEFDLATTPRALSVAPDKLNAKYAIETNSCYQCDRRALTDDPLGVEASPPGG